MIKKFFFENKVEFIIFLIFFIYFFIWSKTNYNFVVINNTSLDEAIILYNFNPYISYLLFNFFNIFKLNFFLGYILLPSFVAVILYKIFFKILNSVMWAISIMLLSMTGTENFPLINFLVNLLNLELILRTVNTAENFEIMGFPIPSFSVLYFCILYYLSFQFIKISEKKTILLTFFWALGPFIHPVDGLIGFFFWNLLVLIFIFLNRLKAIKKIVFVIILLNLLVFLLIATQVKLENMFLNPDQNYPTYNFIVYFFLPLALILFCIILLKIDSYEFIQKFLPIYILMFIEFILIILSINGKGFDLKMLQTRVTMFLLHFLYYVPIIYYLSKDEFFLIKRNQKFYFVNFLKSSSILIFQKLKNYYLIVFSILILIYFFLSLKI